MSRPNDQDQNAADTEDGGDLTLGGDPSAADETEGHSVRARFLSESGETEGHGTTIRIRDERAPSVDDAEGHRFVPVDERLAVGDIPHHPDDDDGGEEHPSAR